MIKIGDKAPNFTLRDTDKTEHSLSDYSGKNVVILFFPLAFSGLCTDELCQVRDDKPTYEGFNAQVIGISVDSFYSLAKFKEEQGYNFPLLSDWNKDTARAYDALYEDFVLGMKGVAKRSAFVVDKEGYIRYSEVLENAGELPDFNKIKETLERLN